MSILLRLLLLLAAFAVTADVLAQTSKPAPTRQREHRRSEAADSVRRIERETGGEVLRSDRMQRDGREVYRVKVLTPEGRVRVMQDDPGARRERERAKMDRAPARDRAPEPERQDPSDDPANH